MYNICRPPREMESGAILHLTLLQPWASANEEPSISRERATRTRLRLSSSDQDTPRPDSDTLHPAARSSTSNSSTSSSPANVSLVCDTLVPSVNTNEYRKRLAPRARESDLRHHT